MPSPPSLPSPSLPSSLLSTQFLLLDKTRYYLEKKVQTAVEEFRVPPGVTPATREVCSQDRRKNIVETGKRKGERKGRKGMENESMFLILCYFSPDLAVHSTQLVQHPPQRLLFPLRLIPPRPPLLPPPLVRELLLPRRPISLSCCCSHARSCASYSCCILYSLSCRCLVRVLRVC